MGVKGCKIPQVWTKPLRKLTPATSRGFECIKFARDILQIELLPWQEWALVHLLETRPNGELRFRTVIIEVARQNGKTTLAIVLCLWRMFLDGSALVLGTAQSLETSEDTWGEAVEIVESNPELAPLIAPKGVKSQNGKKELKLVSGAKWKVAPTNRRGGRSKSADTVLFDELREHSSWEAWSAIANTTIAKKNAIVLGISNAGDKTSVVLKELRKKGIEQAEKGTALGYFGWAAAKDDDISDPVTWAKANPGLGYTVSEEALADALATQPETEFKTENLCMWVESVQETAIKPEDWQALVDKSSVIDPSSPLSVGVDVSADRLYTSVCVSGWRDDGIPHVEVVACRAGMLWVTDWLADFARKWEPASVLVQARGCGASELIDPIEKTGLQVRPVGGSMLGAATGQFLDRVRDGTLAHLGQPALDVAVAGSIAKGLGESKVITRKDSPADAAPLVAAMWALYGLAHEQAEDTRLSAYSSMASDWWNSPPTPAVAETPPKRDGSQSRPWWA